MFSHCLISEGRDAQHEKLSESRRQRRVKRTRPIPGGAEPFTMEPYNRSRFVLRPCVQLPPEPRLPLHVASGDIRAEPVRFHRRPQYVFSPWC